MRRVAVTGMGVISPIGDTAAEVAESLREARSGVVAAPEYAELGFRCQVHAAPKIDWEALVDRRAARFLAPGTAYAHIAMEQAIADAGLDRGGGVRRTHRPDRRLRRTLDPNHRRGGRHHPGQGRQADRALRRAQGDVLGPVGDAVDLVQDPRDQLFDLLGLRDLRPTASAPAIEQILLGKQDVVFAGGCEELDWTLSSLFDAMGAMSSGFNDTPAVASRAL